MKTNPAFARCVTVKSDSQPQPLVGKMRRCSVKRSARTVTFDSSLAATMKAESYRLAYAEESGAMKTLFKLAVISGLMCLSLVVPAAAQIVNGVDFTTSFPFYAGNAKMPAGAYTVTQPQGDDTTMLLIESKSGSHSVFLENEPTQSANPHPQTDVTFKKYGTTEYLSQIWVAGQNYGMQIPPTKLEQKAAAHAAATQHSVTASAR